MQIYALQLDFLRLGIKRNSNVPFFLLFFGYAVKIPHSDARLFRRKFQP